MYISQYHMLKCISWCGPAFGKYIISQGSEEMSRVYGSLQNRYGNYCYANKPKIIVSYTVTHTVYSTPNNGLWLHH